VGEFGCDGLVALPSSKAVFPNAGTVCAAKEVIVNAQAALCRHRGDVSDAGPGDFRQRRTHWSLLLTFLSKH
jgi:hypothetical protein